MSCNSAIQTVSVWFIVFWVTIGSAWSQDRSAENDVREGHRLAVRVCAICHVAAADQETMPILHPAAPPFASIAQRPDITPDSLKHFLATTHRNLETQGGMPNPQLLDFQITQVSAYLLSLRK